MREPIADRLRRMDLDLYVEWLLDNGYYAVNVAAGVVINRRSGVPLASRRNKSGHPVVALAYGPGVSRKAMVSRVVATKLWGPVEIHGLHVRHLDGDLENNTKDNLSLGDTPEWKVGRPPKTSWESCSRCGDQDGYVGSQGKTPVRVGGGRFGIDGKICHKCYGFLFQRQVRGESAT